MSFTCYLVTITQGKMVAYLPHKEDFAGYAARYVGSAFGFVLGYNHLFKYFVQTTSNIDTSRTVVQYWTLSVPIYILTGESSDTFNVPPSFSSISTVVVVSVVCITFSESRSG
jgi:hypothetical protein